MGMVVSKQGTQTITEYENTWKCGKRHVLCHLGEGREGGQPVVQGLHANLTMRSFYVHSWVFCTLPLEIFTEVIKGKLSLPFTGHFLVYFAAATPFQIKYKRFQVLLNLSQYATGKLSSHKKNHFAETLHFKSSF